MRRLALALLLALTCFPPLKAASFVGFLISVSNPITVSFTPSRAVTGGGDTCVAPCAVYFDATATTDSVITSTLGVFHDAQFSWDFGDTAGGATWTNGAGQGSKNAAYGPVTGHVFETAGTYTVTLTVYDGTNTNTGTASITVTDADTYFSTTKTVCISTSGTFTGCPTGATHVTSSDWDAAFNANVGAGKRLLFRRGETFTASTSANIQVTGPGLVGAYDTGAAPIVQASANNVNIIEYGVWTQTALADWRIMDLEFTGNGHSGNGGVMGNQNNPGSFDQLMIFRMNIHDVHNAMQFNDAGPDFANANGHPGHHLYTGSAVVETTTTNVTGTTGGHSIFGAGNQYMVMGNSLNNNGGGEHTFRTVCANGFVFSNNTIAGAASTKHLIKLHSYSYDTTGAWNAPSDFDAGIASVDNPTWPTTGTYTQNGVISDNKFVGGSEQWMVALGPQDNAHDERLRDIIVERNWFVASSSTTIGMISWVTRTTIRNNLFNLSGGADQYVMPVLRRGIEGTTAPTETYPNYVSIYNNSAYSSSAGTMIGIELAPSDSGMGTNNTAANVVAKNNLAYSPSGTSPNMIHGTGASPTISATNNSSDAQMKSTSPNFTATPPATTAGWKPTSGYAIGGGTSVPVWSDFFLLAEPAPRDVGAVKH
jgi:hypothetical protein